MSCMLYPGAKWFHQELVPSSVPVPASYDALDPQNVMAVFQLGNCYFLLALLSSLVFRAVRDTLPNNPMAQERILGASFLALGIADLTHIIATLVALPPDVRFGFVNWNSVTHGNVTVVVFLFTFRMLWYLGVGRTRYWYGQSETQVKKRS